MSEWIDVKQALPQEKGWYLVAGRMSDGHWRFDVARFLAPRTFFGHALQFNDVMHWMPLPAPPETT